MLLTALALIGLFVFLQEMAKNRSDFLFLMSSSFIFPASGTFLTMKTFTKSSGVEKKLCLVVAVIFIVALLFVANSLACVPRGGFYNRTWVTPSSFTLTTERSWDGSYSGENSQIIHTASYPVASIWISEGKLLFNNILFKTQTVIRMNATFYVFLMLKPYEEFGRAIFSDSITFNETESEVYKQPRILMLWGNKDPPNRTRLDGYDLQFTIELYGKGPDIGPVLNFTVDMSNFRLIIDDFVVDSKLQNGLSITLTGVFIGIVSYIPGKFLSKFLVRKT